MSLLGIPVVAVWLLGRYAGPVGGAAGSHPVAPDPFRLLLVALPVMLMACYLGARLLRLLRQPPVVGEIFAGIALGPSLLGWMAPGAAQWLFPAYLLPTVNTLAQLGLVFFLFIVGHELDLGVVRQRGQTAVAVSVASIAVPFVSGLLLAVGLYPRFGPPGIGLPAFALFLAASMSVTAFPVLARILTDRGIVTTPLGALALTAAAVDDVVAWCLLAGVVAITHDSSAIGMALTLAWSLAFALAMVLLVRPLLAKLDRWAANGRAELHRAALPVLLSGLLLSALATDRIGIHPIFGAFLFGTIVPRNSALAARATEQLRGITLALLLPLFFVYTGLHTDLRLLAGSGTSWLWCAAICAVAIAGKFGGSAVAARVAGVGWRGALSLGALMNCRGLTELAVLDVGLELGVLDRKLFSILVVMTLLSTILTTPALTLVDRTGVHR